MGYPIAYRHGARKYGNPGFQNGLPAPKPGPGWKNPLKQPYTPPPKPANDPYPRPDNDNVPGRGRYEHPPFPQLPAWPGFPEEVAAQAMRRFLPPAIVVAADALQIAWDWYRDFQSMPHVDWEGTGWWVVCGPVTPSPAYEGPFRWHDNDAGDSCGLGLQALGPGLPEFRQGMPPYRLLAKYRSDIDRWQIIQQLRSVVTPPQYLPVSAPMAYQPPNPWEFPEPVQFPEPGFIEVPSPGGYSVPETAPMPATLPRTWPAPRRSARPRPRPGRPNYPGSSANQPKPIPGQVNPPPVIIAPPTVSNPSRRPPGKGEKERKARATGALGPLNGLLHDAAGIYEDAKFYQDVIDAWYDALPNNKGAKTPQDKLNELYHRWNDVDINAALWGVLEAIAYEKLGGYIERARNQIARNLGLNMRITVPTGSAPRVR